MPLSVVTINLWNVEGPVHDRMRTLGAWLAERGPDVVALQEVTDLDGVSQADLLASTGGYPHRHLDHARDGGDTGEGLAILSRRRLRPRPTVALPRAPDDPPRAAVVVDIDDHGDRDAEVDAVATPWRVVCTHLAWRLDAGPARTAQTQRLREDLASGDDGASRLVPGVTDRRLIVLGDLNDVPGSPALTALTAAAGDDRSTRWPGMLDALVAGGGEERPTFDRANPYLEQRELAGRRVDHVLVTPDVDVRDARVVFTGEPEPIVSDHYGVLAELA